MQKNKNIFDAGKAAIRGLSIAFKEKAFRRGLVILFAAICLHGYSKSSQSMFVVSLSFLILVAECFNTAIEILCDRICADYDKQIKNIKDVAAAGVFLSVASLLAFLLYWSVLEVNGVR